MLVRRQGGGRIRPEGSISLVDHEIIRTVTVEIPDIPVEDGIEPLQIIDVTATHPSGRQTLFQANVRLDTPVEVDYYRNGGILQTVLRNLAA